VHHTDPESHCRYCRAPIAFYDNIPIVSFVLLHGRCRSCGMRIPVRYLLVELLTAVLAVILFLRFGLSWLLLVHFVFVSALVVVSVVDLEMRIVPNSISLPGVVLGIALSILTWWFQIKHFPTPLDTFSGVLLGGGLLLLVAWTYEWLTGREGLGGGDVKLMAMIGAFLGWSAVPVTLFVGAVLGSIWGIGLMFAKGVDSKYALPFAPFLCTGALFYLLWGAEFAARYLTVFVVR
jgi:leader peptidase (prepilin peptidase)/N-methyltransferase